MICSLPTLLIALPGALRREGYRALEGASDPGATGPGRSHASVGLCLPG